MKLNKLYKCLLFLNLLYFTPYLGRSQHNYEQNIFKKKFDSIFEKNEKTQNSFKNILMKAELGNSIRFMDICYSIDALNSIYKATDSGKYLKANEKIINEVFTSGTLNKNNELIWIAKSNHYRFKEINNKEVILNEGYIFRYISEYLYNNKLRDSRELKILENIFLKWYSRSIKNYGDDSKLQGVRTHIGSHWATTAMYLYLLSDNLKNKMIYKSVYKRYNLALRNNLKVGKHKTEKYYYWNSTWDTPYTFLQNQRRKKNKDKKEIQDVTHGNHIVQYILNSYELGLNSWSLKDINLLSNTLRYVIWNSKNFSFSDNINGTLSKHSSIKNTGWKQSDGWMKLMKYDSSLVNIYYTWYKENKNKIDNSYLNLQFYSNFLLYTTITKNHD